MPYVFIVPGVGCFVSQGVRGVYATPTATERHRSCPPIPARYIAVMVHAVPGVAHVA